MQRGNDSQYIYRVLHTNAHTNINATRCRVIFCRARTYLFSFLLAQAYQINNHFSSVNSKNQCNYTKLCSHQICILAAIYLLRNKYIQSEQQYTLTHYKGTRLISTSVYPMTIHSNVCCGGNISDANASANAPIHQVKSQ